jgi:glucosyl-3-phosphoglycerate synthase
MNAGDCLLLPVCCADDAEGLLPVAAALAGAWQMRVSLLGIVCIPPDESLSRGASRAQELRQELAGLTTRWAAAAALPIARVSHTPWDEIAAAVAESNCGLLILPWPADGFIFGKALAEVLDDPPCDVAIVRPACQAGEGAGRVRSILLPIRGGPHAALALRVSEALAEAFEAGITALHAGLPTYSPAADAPFVGLLPALQELPSITRLVTLPRADPGAILAEAQQHDAVIMGATAHAGVYQGPEAIGPFTARVFRETKGTVIAVKTRQEIVYPEPAPERTAEAPVEGGGTSNLVDKWFAENTFHSREFQDLQALLELKRAQGLSISLGLPALNEERTVGNVITTLKGALMDEVPLLDEIVLIDSDSTDRTRQIGLELGIPVYVHQQILPQYGAFPGKGEALWKSLYVLKGDIVIWVDTDITNIHPRFVFGILGPLLREKRVQYVKGFYRRPIHVGEVLEGSGGGRVTELVARPMLNLFYPVLSGVVQPLAGEYAGRRSALERLPFFTGYGVETGLLIDVLKVFGLPAIAQCDLEERIHKNQNLAALGKMSFQILQVFMRRLSEERGLLPAEINRTMKLVQHDQGRFYLDMQDIEEQERPPMIELAEYRQARGLSIRE